MSALGLVLGIALALGVVLLALGAISMEWLDVNPQALFPPVSAITGFVILVAVALVSAITGTKVGG
ncbi:hypothetical protein [Puerhibacterium puerhi]|uniref:hypothetical protein n=1 Tax=Puerhibacterium puerhi TaxID=2692623 RepID=UPI00135BA417|nr:hypothetical protein [Puerhibacterium puerhi]